MKPEKILQIVSDYFEMPKHTMTHRCNRDEVIKAKHIAIYFICRFTTMKSFDIGEMFGYSDRSAVTHAFKSVSKQRQFSFEYRHDVNEIEKLIEESEVVYYDEFQENDFYTLEETKR